MTHFVGGDYEFMTYDELLENLKDDWYFKNITHIYNISNKKDLKNFFKNK